MPKTLRFFLLWLLWLAAGLMVTTPAAAEFQLGKPGESSLRIGALFQLRYTGLDQSESSENSFQIRRLRLRFDGDAFPHIGYEIQIAGDALTTATPDRLRLLDANVVFNYNSLAQVKAGQFKAPFGAEQLTSPERLHSIERALLDQLTPSRQLGVMLTSAPNPDVLSRGSTARRLEYGIGVFNGNGINQPSNDNSDSLLAGRVVVSPAAGVRVGASVLTSNDAASTAAFFTGLAVPGRRNVFGADFYANQGLFHLWAEYAGQSFNPEGADRDRSARGFYIEPSFYLMKQKLEIWYRYDDFDPQTGIEDNLDKQWSHVGVNYYVRDHNFKLQGEYIAKREKGISLDDDTFRLQVQVLW